MSKAQTRHASLIKQGLQNHVYRCNLLLQSYVKSNALHDARKLLDTMPTTNAVSYNTVLSGYFNSGLVTEALHFFSTSPKRDCQSWNIAISGFVKNERLEEALSHFSKLRLATGVRPDCVTYTTVIPCCDVGLGKQVHGEIVKMGVNWDAFVGTNLTRMYMGASDMHSARKMFDEMPERDLVSWNSLISCCSKHGKAGVCMELFRELCREGILPDEYTYSIILNELLSHCQLFEAMQVHSAAFRSGYCSDCFIANAVVDLYFRCGLVDYACKFFEEMVNHDIASWTTMIVRSSNCGQMGFANSLFHKMRLHNIEPNSFTFGGMLGVCATSNALLWGKQIHALVWKFGLVDDMVIGSALLEMYCKCSEMDDALKAFQGLPEKDIVSWNGIICGYAVNGEATKALHLYNQMLREGSSPNSITFVGVLSACSHSGLVEEGHHHFSDMIHKHLIKPTKEHYTCMVDLLGRAGHLDKAEALLLKLPSEADAVMWGALLGACRLHGNFRMARRAAEHLLACDPWSSSNYVLLANSFTNTGRWGEAIKVRELMEARGVQKNVGCSWVDIGGCMHLFLAGDKLHPLIESVYEVLHKLHLHIDEGVTLR